MFKFRIIAPIFVFIAFFLSLPQTNPVRAEGVEFALDQMSHIVGLGMGMVPDYEGSDDYTFAIAPFLKWKMNGSEQYVMVQGYEVKVNILDHPWLRFGPSLNYKFGRDDSVDDHVVSKMKEIDDTIEGGAYIGIELIDKTNPRSRFIANLNFLTDLGNEHDGYTAYLNLRSWYPLSTAIDYGAGFSLVYASENYMDTYFGVSKKDSQKTGLAEFDPDSGVKDFRIHQILVLHLNKNWHLAGGVQYRRLLNDADDSPIVDKRGSSNQWLGGIGIAYSW